MKNNSLNSVGDSNISSISNGDYSETTDDMMMNSFENSNTEKCQVELDSKKFENDLEINDDRSTTLSISCEDCGKSFKGKQSLKFHIDSVHKGIKYSCESCGKSYTQKAVLNRHVKTLHGGISTKFKQDESKNGLISFGDNDVESTTKEEFQILQNDISNDFEPRQLAINPSTVSQSLLNKFQFHEKKFKLLFKKNCENLIFPKYTAGQKI